MERWEVKGAFNMRPSAPTYSFKGKALTNLSMAHHMCVEVGNEVNSLINKKRQATTSSLGPSPWSQKRRKTISHDLEDT